MFNTLFSKLSGIISNTFQLNNGNGVIIRNIDETTIDIRNYDNSDYAIIRGQEPLGIHDLATKNYVDNSVSLSSGVMKAIKIPFSYSGSSTSLTIIPTNNYIFSIIIDITTPFINANTIIKIGNISSIDFLYNSINDPIDITTIETYKMDLAKLFTDNSNIIITIENPYNGFNTAIGANKLFDSFATFITWDMQIGDIVKNVSTGLTTTIANIDTETELTLTDDIFQTYNLITTGTNTSVIEYKLEDNMATFITDGVIASNFVINTDDNTKAEITSVISETELLLNADIFSTTPKNYEIIVAEDYEIIPNTQGNGTCFIFYSEPLW